MESYKKRLNPLLSTSPRWLFFILVLSISLLSYESIAQCNPFNVGGGGTICSGYVGITITLDGSQAGLTYQLKRGTTKVGLALTGTGSSLSWSDIATAGTYTIVATKSSAPTCSLTMTGSATVTVNALPTKYKVSGSGAVCSGATGLTIKLGNSQTGVTYQLVLGLTPVGSAVSGTGAAISWSGIITAGSYTVMATNTSTNCQIVMNGSAAVTVNQPPASFTVSNGGSICAGDPGVTITLSNSETGVDYQLKRGTAKVGAVLVGSGSSLSWTNNTTAGSYTVVATNPTSGCVTAMSGLATITVNTLPTSYTVQGTASICTGSSSAITLTGSQTTVNYQLQLNGPTNVGALIPGTGVSLSWPNQSTAGAYSVYAISTEGCQKNMAESATLTIKPLPQIFDVTGGGSFCTGATGPTIGLSGSVIGTRYQLKNDTTKVGSAKTGTGAALSWTNITSTGTLSIVATLSACTQNMNGSANVSALTAPAHFTISSPTSGGYCAGTSGATVTLSGSEIDASYQLKKGSGVVGSPQAGTGGILTWTNIATAGTYTLLATSTATGCTTTMTGSVAVSAESLPALYIVSGGGEFCAGVAGVPVTLANSQTNKLYQLKLAGVAIGVPQNGTTGTALTWNGLTQGGTYTVDAYTPKASCTRTMTGSATITVNPTCITLYNLAFQYRYDARKRMTQKKVPGADWVYMVYDDRDRLVLTQDGNQRLNNQWTFTKYDGLNRPVNTGIYSPGQAVVRDTMQSNVNKYYHHLTSSQAWYESFSTGSGNVHNYDNKSFPQVIDSSAYLTVTYYDDNTSIKNLWGTNYNYTNDNLTSGSYTQPGIDFRNVVGHPVAGKIKLLDSSNTWLKSVMFYDDHYRVIQTIADNNKGGYDRASNLFDFVGKTLATKTTHHTSTHSDQFVDRSFEYDHVGRLLKTWHSLNGATPVLLTENQYNELGQLVDKKLYSTDNGNNFKQSVDYRYTIRGWLTSINDSQLAMNSINDDANDLFGMNLLYDQQDGGLNNDRQFNGNISAIKWSNNLAVGTTKNIAYNYSYDTMNRIKSAAFLTNPGIWTSSSNFAENGFSYDLNGNIKKLTRTNASGGLMDQLTYDYTGQGTRSNQLKSVTDAGDILTGFTDGNIGSDDYSYDLNGNMITDKNKNISTITYNYLNLPQQVTKGTGEKIIYTYDAGGRKLAQQVYNASEVVTKRTDYDGEFIYQNDTLYFINHEEGRIVMKPLSSGEAGVRSEYQYHLKDHLGNVRLTFTTTPTTEQPVATFESATTATEQSQFLRYDDVRLVSSTIFDHTYDNQMPPTAGAFSERLSGSANEKTGIARSISVMPGDTVEIEVYAKYVDGNNSSNTEALKQLLGQILMGTASAGTVIDGAGYLTNGITPFPYTGFAGEGNDPGTGPKAYLNYLIFDRNFVFVNGGYVRMTNFAKEDGSNVAHERLAPPPIVITQPGYVYAYLSNEETSPVEVYFDDFKVTQIKSLVVQMEDFYPFGLTFNSTTRENSVPQNYLYNGKEQINDLNLDWADYGARMYMPELGRFFSIDLLSEKFSSQSPYAYAANDPIKFIDVMGLGPGDPAPGELSSRNCKCETQYTKPADESYNIKVKAPDGTYHSFEQADGFHFTYSDGKFHDDQQKKAGVWSVTSHGENYMWDNVKGKYVKNTSNKGGGENSFVTGESFLIGESAGTTYAGGDNPKNKETNDWDYSQPGQNVADHVGYVHDKAFDSKQIEGFSGTMSKSSTAANKQLISSALQVVKMYSAGAIDPYTGAKVSKKTADTAARMAILFMIVEANKAK